MFKFKNEINNTTDILIDETYAFITKDISNNAYHFYIVSDEGTIIEISSNDMPEFNSNDTLISTFAFGRDEEVIKIFKHPNDFTLTLEY